MEAGKKMGFVVDNLVYNVAWIWLCLMDLTETFFFFMVQTASSVPEEEEDEQSSLEWRRFFGLNVHFQFAP